MFSTFHRHSSTGYRIGSMSTARTNPEAEPRLTALTTTVPLSSTSEYSVCFAIFSKVSGSQESGKAPPVSAAENLPTSSVTGDWALRVVAVAARVKTVASRQRARRWPTRAPTRRMYPVLRTIGGVARPDSSYARQEFIYSKPSGPNEASQRALGHFLVKRHGERGQLSFLRHDDVAASLPCHAPAEGLEESHDFLPA